MEKDFVNNYSILDASNIELTTKSQKHLYQLQADSHIPIKEKNNTLDIDIVMDSPKFEIYCKPTKLKSILKKGVIKSIKKIKKAVTFSDINPDLQINKIIEVESFKAYNSLFEEEDHCCCNSQ